MKKKRFIITTTLVLVFFMCTGTLSASAASLSQITKNIKQKQTELSAGQAKESSLNAQMNALEQKVDVAEQNIDRLDTAIAEAEVQLEVLEKELKEAEAKVDTQNENLGSRLRNMYKNGSIGFVDVLMDSNSFSEFLTNLDLVEKIYSSDKEVLSGLQDAYDEIDIKKTEVETLQADLTESKQVAEEEKATLEADRATVAEQKTQIAASNDNTAKMIDEMQADADRITAELKASSSSGGASSSSTSKYTGGQMAWPTPSGSRITSKFGWRYNPFTGRSEFHFGMDISAPGGSPVVAANPGKVIYAGWKGTYGKCVMIDHGGGVVTLYAHNSSILVKKGQSVSRGQQISKVGTTGASTGNHCHFEVRVNGSYKNPYPYVT